MIRNRLKTTYSLQKSYADNRRRDLKFDVGDEVFKNFTYEMSDEIWKEGEA